MISIKADIYFGPQEVCTVRFDAPSLAEIEDEDFPEPYTKVEWQKEIVDGEIMRRAGNEYYDIAFIDSDQYWEEQAKL